MREEIRELKMENFAPLLKALEGYVKNFDERMLSGENFPEWNLKPREIWGNWLLCALLQKKCSEQFIFSDDEHLDGTIIDKRKGMYAWRLQMEHVLVCVDATNEGVISAINEKIEHNYSSSDRMGLVVLSNRKKEWNKDVIENFIIQNSKFRYIFVINLLCIDENGFSYSVVIFGDGKFAKHTVQINSEFTFWVVH